MKEVNGEKRPELYDIYSYGKDIIMISEPVRDIHKMCEYEYITLSDDNDVRAPTISKGISDIKRIISQCNFLHSMQCEIGDILEFAYSHSGLEIKPGHQFKVSGFEVPGLSYSSKVSRLLLEEAGNPILRGKIFVFPRWWLKPVQRTYSENEITTFVEGLRSGDLVTLSKADCKNFLAILSVAGEDLMFLERKLGEVWHWVPGVASHDYMVKYLMTVSALKGTIRVEKNMAADVLAQYRSIKGI